MVWVISSENPIGIYFLSFTQVFEFNFKCPILSVCLSSYICIEILSKENGTNSKPARGGPRSMLTYTIFNSAA